MWPRSWRLLRLSLPLDDIANYHLAVLVLVELFQVKIQLICSSIVRNCWRVVLSPFLLLPPRHCWDLRYIEPHLHLLDWWWRTSRLGLCRSLHIFRHELPLPRWSCCLFDSCCWRLMMRRGSSSLCNSSRHSWRRSWQPCLRQPQRLWIVRRHLQTLHLRLELPSVPLVNLHISRSLPHSQSLFRGRLPRRLHNLTEVSLPQTFCFSMYVELWCFRCILLVYLSMIFFFHYFPFSINN